MGRGTAGRETCSDFSLLLSNKLTLGKKTRLVIVIRKIKSDHSS